MSLISVISNHGFPVIISDRAFSKKNEVNTTALPTINQEVDFSKYDYATAPYTFGMKTIIIKDLLCVGFAGVVNDLEEAHNSITDFFLHREVNEETLNELLAENNFSKYISSSFLFVLGLPEHGDRYVSVTFIGNWSENAHPSYDHLKSTGSGTQTWDEKFSQNAPYLDQGNQIYLSLGIQKVMLTSLFFLNEEIRTPDNLLDGWGGGFDIIYYSERKFQRLNNVVYTFWRVDIARPDEMQLISTIHNEYDDDKLIIRNFDGNELKVYILGQMNDHMDATKPYGSLYEAKYIASCIRVYDGNNSVSNLFVGYTGNPEEPLFKTQDIDGYLAFGFQIGYEDGLKASIREFLG